MPSPDHSTAGRLRELMELLRSPTQDEIANKLGVRREYVSRILNGLEPSEQLKKAILMALDQEKTRRAFERDEKIYGALDPALVGEDAPPKVTAPTAEEKRRLIRVQLEELIRAAGDDHDRLGFIAETLRLAFLPTAQWNRLVPEERPAVRRAREEAVRIDWQRQHEVSVDPQQQKAIVPPAQKAGA